MQIEGEKVEVVIDFLFFSSSLLSTIMVVSSAYLRLLIFLPEILILACDSYSLAFLMMYSAYKLNKQGDNIQSCLTPFPIWWLQPWTQKTFATWQESYDKPRQYVEKQRHYSADKGLYS